MRVELSVDFCPESHKAERSEVRTVPSRRRAFVCNDKQGVLHPDPRLRRWTVDLNRSVRCLLKKGPRGSRRQSATAHSWGPFWLQWVLHTRRAQFVLECSLGRGWEGLGCRGARLAPGQAVLESPLLPRPQVVQSQLQEGLVPNEYQAIRVQASEGQAGSATDLRVSPHPLSAQLPCAEDFSSPDSLRISDLKTTEAPDVAAV